MTILEKIAKGESRILEFKEAIPSSKNFSKTIISFSNGSGGELLLGVKDTGEIIGIDEELELPIIRESANFLQIIFKRPRSEWRKSGEKVAKSSEKGSEKSSEKIVKLIKENPEASAESLAQMIGISQRAVEKQLANLKQKGLLKRFGPAKGGYWQIQKC